MLLSPCNKKREIGPGLSANFMPELLLAFQTLPKGGIASLAAANSLLSAWPRNFAIFRKLGSVIAVKTFDVQERGVSSLLFWRSSKQVDKFAPKPRRLNFRPTVCGGDRVAKPKS